MVGVTVTPNPSTSSRRPPNTNGFTANFTVKNTSASQDTYTMSCGTSSNITCTGMSPNPVTLGAGASTTVSATYNTGGGGSGWLQMCAEGNNGVGCGQQTIPVNTAQVTPDGANSVKRQQNTNGYGEVFTVKNTGAASMTYTITCLGSSNVTCTGVNPTSLTLGAGAQTTDTGKYNVGAVGTGTLKLIATSGSDADTGSYTIPVVNYSVTVTPDSGETTARRQNYTNYGETFAVKNTGSDTDTYTFSCVGSANIVCYNGPLYGNNPIPSSATVAPGATVNVIASYSTGVAGTGRLTLSASSSHTSDQGWYWIPVTTKTVGITPINLQLPGAFTGTNRTQQFTVTNTDVVSHKYWIDCSGNTGVTCTPPLSDSLLLMAVGQSGNSWTTNLAYTIASNAPLGASFVQLSANDHYATGQATFTIYANTAHAVSVSPTTGTGPNLTSFTNGYTATFTVQNIGTSTDTYTFTCDAATTVTCTNVSPGSLSLASLASTTVTVTFNTGASGSKNVTMKASNANATSTGRWNYTVNPSAGYAVVVTPDAKPIGVLALTSASYPFIVTNTGTASNTYTIAATCTGAAIASGCTPSISSTTLAPNATSTVNVTYTSGGGSTTGTIKLFATQSSDAAVKDSGWINLATGTAQAPTAAVSTVNPGVTVERGLCLTIGLVGGAASECGDLRLAHGLPIVRTMGRVRAPTLIYSSAQAHPYPLVAAEVTLPTGSANPDSVQAILKLNGTERRRAGWLGSAFSPGRANRIVIGYDALGIDTTGVYSYTLEVKNYYSSGPLSASPIPSGEFIIVDRSSSEYGAGWWLAGMERIKLDSMLWIGGDGSARVYRSTGISNVWAAAVVNRPDTLKKIGTEYVRYLPGKAEVWFDASGRQEKTVSRLQHDTTVFHRNASTGKLDSITVAPASQAIRFKFVYNSTSGLLDSVIAPPVGTIPRADKITRTGSQITSIRDPDTSSVSFGYDGSFTNRIITRTNRLGTSAFYFFDAAGKVSKDSLNPVQSPAIVKRLRSHESAGFIGSTALDTAVASAAVDGPRTDVGDSTLFWMDRFGEPRRVRNPLDAETNVQRQDPTYPVLVTRSQSPNGQVVRATYDVRGHVLTSTDSGTILNGVVAVTRYAWNNVWDADTIVVPPELDSTVVHIDPTTGHRMWQQDARGSVSRANFTYYATTGLLATIQEAGITPVTTLNYDAVGNMRQNLSPLGFRDSVYTDNIGRDTLDVSPIDAGQTKFQRKRTTYDVANRPLSITTSGPATTYSLTVTTTDTTPVVADSAVVVNTYNHEGWLTEIDTYARPQHAGDMDEIRTYDAAGRLLSKRLGAGPSTFTYDAAGNAVTQSYRTGAVVSAQFDALNRMVKRIVPRRVWPRTDCTGHQGYDMNGTCLARFPQYANLVGDSLEVPADTVLFGFDTAGDMIQADNRDAHIRRSYAINGTMTSDSLWLRNYTNTAFGTVYGLRYGYDKDERRTWMKLPVTLAPGADSMAYSYSVDGALIRVRDGSNRRDSLTYTPAGRLDSLKVFDVGASTPGIKESRHYDADGRMTSRERRTGSNSVLQSDSLTYDARGDVSVALTTSAATDQGSLTSTMYYDGMGAVVASQVQSSIAWNTEEYRTDGLGNVWYQHARTLAGGDPGYSLSTYTGNQLLSERDGFRAPTCAPSSSFLDQLNQSADVAGNVTLGDELHLSCASTNYSKLNHTNSYYSADNRLAAVELYDGTGSAGGTWEEYRYDALGRRVMTRTRREQILCSQTLPSCFSFVERVVWDGDQILFEQRTSDLDIITGGAPNYGTVGYVHVLGIDHPVQEMDGRVIHYNWRGLGESSSWANGNPADCELMTGTCTTIAWPAGQGVYYRRATDPYSGLQVTWIGSLPANGANTTGQLYRRNRYFDQASGRFSQEDPIGLAGGLNLYGLASGDPINYSDPFGLCVPMPLCLVTMVAVWGAETGGPIGHLAYNSAVESGDLYEQLVQLCARYNICKVDADEGNGGTGGGNGSGDNGGGGQDKPQPAPSTEDQGGHRKKRPSTQEDHDKAEERRKRDKRGGEKGDDNRPYRKTTPPKKKGVSEEGVSITSPLGSDILPTVDMHSGVQVASSHIWIRSVLSEEKNLVTLVISRGDRRGHTAAGLILDVV